LLHVEVHDLRTTFDGRNGWWIPNMVNFCVNSFFLAWFVATEEYSLGFVADAWVQSVDSGVEVWRGRFPIGASGTFDDFDHGWKFFAPIFTSLEGDGWRTVAEKLLPAARSKLAATVAIEADKGLRDAASKPAFAESTGKVLVLSVGVGECSDSKTFPPLPYAREDAQSVASAFVRLGLAPRNVVTLVDSAATRDALAAAIQDHLGRAHPDDVIVFHFAGYGTILRTGEPALALHDATRDDDAKGLLPLDELVSRLKPLPGRKLIVIDAGFSGVGRSIAANGPSRRPEPQVDGSVSLVVADAGEGSAFAPDYLKSGLLTYHFVRGLDRLRDLPPGATAALDDVVSVLGANVTEDAEMLGLKQAPRVMNPPRGFLLHMETGSRKEVP
jgi:hypothetical protein